MKRSRLLSELISHFEILSASHLLVCYSGDSVKVSLVCFTLENTEVACTLSYLTRADKIRGRWLRHVFLSFLALLEKCVHMRILQQQKMFISDNAQAGDRHSMWCELSTSAGWRPGCTVLCHEARVTKFHLHWTLGSTKGSTCTAKPRCSPISVSQALLSFLAMWQWLENYFPWLYSFFLCKCPLFILPTPAFFFFVEFCQFPFFT